MGYINLSEDSVPVVSQHNPYKGRHHSVSSGKKAGAE